MSTDSERDRFAAVFASVGGWLPLGLPDSLARAGWVIRRADEASSDILDAAFGSGVDSRKAAEDA